MAHEAGSKSTQESSQGETYYILSGHNRVEAFRLLERKSIPAIVKRGITTEAADLIVVETNLRQREKLLPSEKAWAYKMQLAALKKQGKRTDLEGENPENQRVSGTLSPLDTKLNSGDNVANDNSRANIYRYMCLTNLISALLDLVDEEVLPLRAGVELSYLQKSEQTAVYDYFFTEQKARLDLKTAAAIRKLSKQKPVTYESIDKLITGISKKKQTNTDIKIPMKKLGVALDGVPEARRMDYIVEALLFYRQYNPLTYNSGETNPHNDSAES